MIDMSYMNGGEINNMTTDFLDDAYIENDEEGDIVKEASTIVEDTY